MNNICECIVMAMVQQKARHTHTHTCRDWTGARVCVWVRRGRFRWLISGKREKEAEYMECTECVHWKCNRLKTLFIKRYTIEHTHRHVWMTRMQRVFLSALNIIICIHDRAIWLYYCFCCVCMRVHCTCARMLVCVCACFFSWKYYFLVFKLHSLRLCFYRLFLSCPK